MKQTKVGRIGKLIGVGTQMIGQSIRNSLTARPKLETRIEQAKLLTQTLSELKGASMKFGQMLSIQGEHLLPPEVAQILSKLQDAAPHFSSEEMWKVVQKELGEIKSKELIFDPNPLAAASIGQVHRVVTPHCAEAVLKIQYPGVDIAVNSEVTILKQVLSVFSKIYIGELEVDSVIDEIQSLLIQELDYAAEGAYLDYFRMRISKESKLNEWFVVPEFFREYSTKKVLCMSAEKGLSMSAFLGCSPAEEARSHVGRALFELYLAEVYKFRTVQTDPNFGNYLIKYDPKDESTHRAPKIALLDFGATRNYSSKLIDNYKKFMLSLLAEDKNLALELAFSLETLSSKESKEVLDLFYEMCQMGITPLMSHYPFDFGSSDLPKRMHESAVEFLKKMRHSSPPRELIFLNRKLGGVYNILRALKSKENFRPMIQEYLGLEADRFP